jgi:transposase InsO family protein
VFDEYCTKNNIRRSLGRTGICYDNAVSESFFATYKKELIHTPMADAREPGKGDVRLDHQLL